MNAINNINDLRDDLMEMYCGLKDGSVANKDASERNNTAGKIIGATKVQLVYYALRKEQPNIPFLAAPVEQPALPAPRKRKAA